MAEALLGIVLDNLIPLKLNEIIGRLDRIAQARTNFDLRQGVRESPSEVIGWRQTSSTITLPQVYGRDEDKKQVLEQFKKRSVEKAESLRTLYQLNSYGFPFSSRLIRTNNSLRVLCIYGRKIPSFGSLTCLRYLELSDLNIKCLPASICNLGRLEILKLRQLWRLRCLPKHLTRMQNLRHLIIDHCESLSEMCPNIHKLNEQLKSISNLNSLNELYLNLNDEVSCFPEGMLNNMTSLATLEIKYFSELKELPSDITKLTALSDLTISKCGKLECLPEQGLEGLSSLRKLSIHYCKSLGSLPHGVRHLTSLQSLSIRGCPMLKERCKQGTGEDWHKIAHVPDLDI
ncbi:hypothetical protein Ahy_B09g094892 [Arachis hypogaea]|uniref:Disease resistance R13L4/SHOC-2-like LRR domain-containing protein n=1 Tax=Arachis hypogaea TaxID=3818 RepID=A0A444XCE2_ARAHY|nr:hypothetical protein Ahy_B09g094892 [Arachis hypogaea]